MNRKIQITKRCIREALFECLKEKGINKITFLAYVKRPISIVPPFISIMEVNMMSLKKWSKKSLN